MTHPDWHEPVRRLRAAAGQATTKQREIADAVRCPYTNEPRAVLTAVIECWLMPTLYGDAAQPATEKQLRFLLELGHTEVSPTMLRPVASAWIDHYLSLQTADALESLQLKAGDQVHHVVDHVDLVSGEVADIGGLATVSSIASNGLVYFRGGNGACGWPTRLRLICQS